MSNPIQPVKYWANEGQVVKTVDHLPGYAVLGTCLEWRDAERIAAELRGETEKYVFFHPAGKPIREGSENDPEGYYFWDETGDHHGPYPDYVAALAALEDYARHL